MTAFDLKVVHPTFIIPTSSTEEEYLALDLGVTSISDNIKVTVAVVCFLPAFSLIVCEKITCLFFWLLAFLVIRCTYMISCILDSVSFY